MNSVDLAQIVWREVRGHSVLADENLVRLVEERAPLDCMSFLKPNALRRLRALMADIEDVRPHAAAGNQRAIEYMNKLIADGPQEGHVRDDIPLPKVDYAPPRKRARSRAG